MMVSKQDDSIFAMHRLSSTKTTFVRVLYSVQRRQGGNNNNPTYSNFGFDG